MFCSIQLVEGPGVGGSGSFDLWMRSMDLVPPPHLSLNGDCCIFFHIVWSNMV